MNTHVKQIQTKLQLDGVSVSRGQKSPSDAKLTPKMTESALFRKQLIMYLSEGMYPGAIIKKYKLDKNKVYYHIRALRKAGIIFLESKARPHFYHVAPRILAHLKKPIAQTTLDQFPYARDQVLKQLIGHDRIMEVNTHHIKVRIDVLKGSLPVPANSKQYKMKGEWLRCRKYIRILGLEVCVFLNHTPTPNIIVQVPQIYGVSIEENHARLLQIGEEVRQYFMQQVPFLELNRPYLTGKKHIHAEDPVIDYVMDKEQVRVEVQTPNGRVWSCKTPQGGREFDNVLDASDYLQMPQYVQELTREFYKLQTEVKKQYTNEERISDLEKGMNRIMGLIEKLLMYTQGQQQLPLNKNGSPPGEMFG